MPGFLAESYDDWIKIVWAISETARQNGYDAVDIADEFSKKSQSNYQGIDDVKKIYAAADGRLGFGTLRYFVTTEKQQDYKADILIEDLCVFEELQHIRKINRITEVKNQQLIEAEFEDDVIRTVILSNNNLVTIIEGNTLGYLQKSVDINYDLQTIHPDFRDKCVCILKDIETIEFVSTDEKTNCEYRIRIKHPWNERKSKRSYYVKQIIVQLEIQFLIRNKFKL